MDIWWYIGGRLTFTVITVETCVKTNKCIRGKNHCFFVLGHSVFTCIGPWRRGREALRRTTSRRCSVCAQANQCFLVGSFRCISCHQVAPRRLVWLITAVRASRWGVRCGSDSVCMPTYTLFLCAHTYRCCFLPAGLIAGRHGIKAGAKVASFGSESVSRRLPNTEHVRRKEGAWIPRPTTITADTCAWCANTAGVRETNNCHITISKRSPMVNLVALQDIPARTPLLCAYGKSFYEGTTKSVMLQDDSIYYGRSGIPPKKTLTQKERRVRKKVKECASLNEALEALTPIKRKIKPYQRQI